MSAVGLRCARPALGAPASGSRPPCAAAAPASAFDVSMRIAALMGASSVEMSTSQKETKLAIHAADCSLVTSWPPRGAKGSSDGQPCGHRLASGAAPRISSLIVSAYLWGSGRGVVVSTCMHEGRASQA